MDEELAHIVSVLDKPKRRKDIPLALDELRECWTKHYSTLLSILRSPGYDRAKENSGLRYPYGPIKELIWKVILESPTKKRVDDLSFLADHTDPHIRSKFVMDAAYVGKPFVLDIVEKALDDSNKKVRRYASIGLRNRSKEGFSKGFAARASQLLFDYFISYPDDSGHPRHEALQAFAPRKYAQIEQELDKADPLRPLLRAVYEVAEDARSHKEAITAFDGYPTGYLYIYALDYVDADIRNGGIHQLHHNSTWHLILDAIEGADAFGFDRLSVNLKEILFYYYRNGRSRMKKRISDGFFDNLPDNWSKDLDTLEKEYYECFAPHGIDGLNDLWNELVTERSPLLQ